jgi:hypothetical protein
MHFIKKFHAERRDEARQAAILAEMPEIVSSQFWECMMALAGSQVTAKATIKELDTLAFDGAGLVPGVAVALSRAMRKARETLANVHFDANRVRVFKRVAAEVKLAPSAAVLDVNMGRRRVRLGRHGSVRIVLV